MRNNFKDHLKTGATVGGGMVLSKAFSTDKTNAQNKQIRIGFVGIGGRGSYHLDCALGIEGIEVPALCEIREDRLNRAKTWVEESGRPTPNLYGKSETDFVRMCETEKLDVVICSTSWEWHAPVCISSMKNGKNAVSEVPIVLTLEEAWELIETAEKTGKWATLGLEQAFIEGQGYLTLYNMVRQDIFGDILHCESGYVHDLRKVKFDPEGEPWRLQHSIDRNGNLYPDHPMSKFIPLMNINHGDRIDYLSSMSSKTLALNEYAKKTFGADNKYAQIKMKQGDYNATILHTTNGNLITLNFDTNTPHPREFFRMQGTKGVFFINVSGTQTNLIYLDGISPREGQWEPADKYFEEYAHPLVKNYNPPPRKVIRGHGSGASKTPLTWHRLTNALRQGKTTDYDIYDSITSSAISPLTEKSVANKSTPIEFPDFTKGKWKTRKLFEFI